MTTVVEPPVSAASTTDLFLLQRELRQLVVQHRRDRHDGDQVQTIALAALHELVQQRLGEQVQDDPLGALGRKRGLARPGGLAREELLLLGLPADDLLHRLALYRRHIHQLLHQPRMRQHQRNRLALIVRPGDRLANERLELAGILRFLPGVPNCPRPRRDAPPPP